jgi:hypothetical protein
MMLSFATAEMLYTREFDSLALLDRDLAARAARAERMPVRRRRTFHRHTRDRMRAVWARPIHSAASGASATALWTHTESAHTRLAT